MFQFKGPLKQAPSLLVSELLAGLFTFMALGVIRLCRRDCVGEIQFVEMRANDSKTAKVVA
eukprot:4013610-Amphidinium_carterae.1